MKKLKKITVYLEHYEGTNPIDLKYPLPSNNFKECVNDWDFNY